MGWFTKADTEAKAPVKFTQMSPEFQECKDGYLCVGIDTEKKLWLCYVLKCDYQTFDRRDHLLRRIKEMYPISCVEKRTNGGILLVFLTNTSSHFKKLERLESGSIYVEDRENKQLFNPTMMLSNMRPFVKQNHPEFDKLECLFSAPSLSTATS